MSTYTSNYAWEMPEGGDPVDITVLNNNLASQDNIVHNAYMQFAPVFSTASTYAVGDVVLYANNLYKCHTAVTVAGDWDATKWTQVKVSDICGGGGGGGTSDYSQLTNLPSVNDVTLLGNKTSADLGLQDAIQIDTMPTASATYEGKIVQFVGTTTASYTHGYYYECIENSGVYSWVQTNVQPSSGGSGGGHTIVNGAGTSMTQRDALQFTSGLAVSDDSTNNRTVVSVTAGQIPYGNSNVKEALDERITTDDGTFTDASSNTYTGVTVDMLSYDATNNQLLMKVDGADTVIPFKRSKISFGTFVSSPTTHGIVNVNCGFEPDIVIVSLPFSSGDTTSYWWREASWGTTNAIWELRPAEPSTYVNNLNRTSGETGIQAINSNGFSFMSNGWNTKGVTCKYFACKYIE